MASAQNEGPSLSEAFSALNDNLQFAIDQLKEGESKRTFPADFSIEGFWAHIGALVTTMSQEATKLCLAFSHPPTPSAEDSQPLIERMEKVTLALVSAYYGFPPTCGTTLQSIIKKNVMSIIQGAQNLVVAMKTSNFQGSPEQLQSTGNVWECCDHFPSLPRDNKLAVLKNCKDAENLIKDAVEEIESEHRQFLETNENELSDDDAPIWDTEGSKIVSAAIGLIKTSRALAKKVSQAVQQHGDCNSATTNAELDQIAETMERLSPAVDDFVLTLYPPVDRADAFGMGSDLKNLLEEILELSRSTHITQEDDQSWVEFIKKAVDHNIMKLQASSDNS